jgi:hypothetical protein
MAKEYVEQRNGGYFVVGTRVSLDSIVECFNEGLSPEANWENSKPLLWPRSLARSPFTSKTSLLLMPIGFAKNDGQRH